MNDALDDRVAQWLATPIRPEVAQYAEQLGHASGAVAVLFYGSNLRTGSLDGVLDFYLLLPGDQQERVWPRVAYHEADVAGCRLRAKSATMALVQFVNAARGNSLDTTIWTRFVQPAALVWSVSDTVREAVIGAVADATRTATVLAAALGPVAGDASAYWRALFEATYRAELRVERAGRADTILADAPAHFSGLLQAAWTSQGIAYEQDELARLCPAMPHRQRVRLRRWWRRRRRLGKPLNLLRLAKATTTFDGAPQYAAWKIARHTGLELPVTPFRQRHPLLAAPGVLYALWRHKRRLR